MTDEPEVERSEEQDDPDVGREPLPEVAPEEQDVDPDHDGHHRDHVYGARYRPSHAPRVDNGRAGIQRLRSSGLEVGAALEFPSDGRFGLSYTKARLAAGVFGPTLVPLGWATALSPELAQSGVRSAASFAFSSGGMGSDEATRT